MDLSGITGDKQTTLVGLGMILATVLLVTHTVTLDGLLPVITALNGLGFMLGGSKPSH